MDSIEFLGFLRLIIEGVRMFTSTIYFGYKDLEQRYKRSRKTIWRWWKIDKILPPPVKIQGRVIGWTSEMLASFEEKFS